MSDKESPIMVHDSDSDSDSDSQTEHASGRDPEPMEGLDNVVQGPVSNCPVLGTEGTYSQRESEELVTIPQKDRSQEVITLDSSDDENEGQVPVPLPSSLQGFGGVGSLRLLEEQNTQSHMVPQRAQTGSVMLEGEQEATCSHPVPAEDLNNITQRPVSNKGSVTPEDNQHASRDDVKSAEEINSTDISQGKRIRGLSPGPSQGPTASSLRINVIQGHVSKPPNGKINVIQGPASKPPLLDTRRTKNQKQKGDQHASGSSVRPEGPPSDHSCERQTTTDCTLNQKDSVIPECKHTNGTDASSAFAVLVHSDQGLAIGLVIPSENRMLLSSTKAPDQEHRIHSECHASGRDLEPAAGWSNVTQGPVPNMPGIQTSDAVSHGKSEQEWIERPAREMNVESTQRSTLNTMRPDFESKLLSMSLSRSLQSRGLKGAVKLLGKMNVHKQIPPHVENQTNYSVPETEQCASDTRRECRQSDNREGSILEVKVPTQIPPQVECIENQTPSTVQVSQKKMTNKEITQNDRSDSNTVVINVDSSDDEDERLLPPVLLSPKFQLQGLEGTGRLLEDVKMPTQIPSQAECIENQTPSAVQVSKREMMSKEITWKDQSEPITVDDKDEGQVLVPLSLSSGFQGLEGEGRLLERELECTVNLMGPVVVEGGQEASTSDQEPAEDLNNVMQGPRPNTPGIQECGMDCTENKEVVVTLEDKQHASGNDVRPAEGTIDRDIPQRRRKRGLSPDPSQGSTTSSPSKRKSKTGGQFRRKDYEKYTEQYLYAIVLPFQCPNDRKVVKVGVSVDPQQRFGKIRCGFNAILRGQSTELKLTDGICLNRSTTAEKIIFISRIQMQVIQHEKAESDIRNLIMAKSLSDEFFDSLIEAIKNTSDTPEEAAEKVKKINHNCAPTEWIMCDTQTVEALRCAYDNGELHGTVRPLTDDKHIWGSYGQFVEELQKVIRNSQ